MVTKKVKWDAGMAVRCAKRVTVGYVPTYVHKDKNPTEAFQTGEWDDFRQKISSEIKKTRR
jgi:hypothetical protein